MAVGLSRDVLALHQKDMYKAYYEGVNEKEATYPKIFKVVTKGIKGGGDKKTQLLGLGDLERVAAERQSIVFEAPVQGWSHLIKYHTFQKGLGLSKDEVEDTVKLGNVLKDSARTWGRSVRVLKETFAAYFFNNGPDLLGHWVFNGTHPANTDTTGNVCYDSEPFFNLSDNTRKNKIGTTYYNSLANSFSPANFETLYIRHAVTNAKDERDRVVENKPNAVIIPTGALEFAVDRALNTTRGFPGQNINDLNPYQGKIKQTIAWDYLTDTDAWVLAEVPTEALEWHERQAPQLRFFRDEVTLDYNASINVRWGAWMTDWRKFTASNFTHA